VKLVPFLPEYLRQDEPLPFGVRDASGRLLLAAGQRVTNPRRLAEFAGQTLFAAEAESADWYRRLAGAMDAQIRQGSVLRDVAAARPEPGIRAPAQPAPLSVPEQWLQLVTQLDGALRDARPEGDWRTRLLSVHGQARTLLQRRTDASLYHLVYEAGHTTQKYSAHHALLSLLICELAAPMLGWAQPWIDSLGRAALTMNVAMLRLQDLLASSTRRPTPEMRAEIDGHAEKGATLLQECGLSDPLCLAVVRLHHDATDADRPLADLAPERQLARLLRRTDLFAAKISLRGSRAPMSPVQAAREACLGAGGVPDEIGSAMLRAVGLYPPGSFVELACGELGIVLARGRRANLPHVAVLMSAGGTPLGEPALRDTIDRRYAIKAAVAPGAVKVLPPHDRLLAMR
jgi:hypothetical protein